MFPFFRSMLRLSSPAMTGPRASGLTCLRSIPLLLCSTAALCALSACQPHVAPATAAYRLTETTPQAAAICQGAAPQKAIFASGQAFTRILLLPVPPGTGASSARVAAGLDEALAAVEKLPDENGDGAFLEAMRLPCVISSHAEARALGGRLNADLVLWGNTAEGGAVIPHFTLLDRSRKLRDDGSTRWSWGEVVDFDLAGIGSGRPDWLANLMVGLHLYRVDQPRAAIHRFELAISEAREAGLDKGLHPLHALLGWSAFLAESPLSAQAALRLGEEEARAANAPGWEAHCIRAQADVAAARGDLAEARHRYGEAIEKYRGLADRQGEADCNMGLADIDVQLSDLPEARRLYREARGAYQELKASEREAGALKGQGDVALWMCDYTEAERSYMGAHDRYASLKVGVGEALTLQRLGDVRLWLSDLAGAQVYYEKALALYQAQGDKSWQADCLMSLGNVRRIASDLAESKTLYQQALSIYRDLKDELGQAHALRTLGDILALGTTYDDARFDYEQAMTLYKARGSLTGEAACLRGLAYLERSFGVGYAKRQYEAALFLSHKAGDKVGEAHSRLGLGQLAVGRMDYFEARDNFERGRILYREAGYPLGEARSLQGLAEANFGLKDSPAAQVYYEEALKIYHQAGLRQGEMQANLSYGQAAMRANDLKLAQGSYEAAVKLARELKDRQGEADGLFLSARLKVRQGRQGDAVKTFEQVREMYRTLGISRNLALASADLGTVLLQTGHEEQGKKLLQEASGMFEQIGMNGEAESCKSLIVAPPAMGDGPVGAR